MLSGTNLLKSGGEKVHKNFLKYSFVKSNLNEMYTDFQLGLRMKIIFFHQVLLRIAL